jgi:hypothetical protein
MFSLSSEKRVCPYNPMDEPITSHRPSNGRNKQTGITHENCWVRSASIIATTTIQQPLGSGMRTEEALSFQVRFVALTQRFWPLNACTKRSGAS